VVDADSLVREQPSQRVAKQVYAAASQGALAATTAHVPAAAAAAAAAAAVVAVAIAVVGRLPSSRQKLRAVVGGGEFKRRAGPLRLAA
jgi:hypothetical protein